MRLITMYGMTPQLRDNLNGFENRDNTLSRVVKDYAADRIELEIGDSKQPQEFMPQAKVMRWDNEVNLSVRRHKPQPVQSRGGRAVEPIARVLNDHAIFEDDKEEVHIYERPDVGEDGGLEIELHLKEKPDTNRFDFTIQTKGLNFYYQPELTEKEKEEGSYQPENVIGSYAVYHATKRDNRVGGKEYKTGKFCHIYRPHITDADGNEVWGELELDEEAGMLTVVVPQAFLDNASYPVIVDPTLGYTSIGGSEQIIASNATNQSYSGVYTGMRVSTSVGGETVSITGAIRKNQNFAGNQVRFYIYERDGNGANSHSQKIQAINNNIKSTSHQWYTSPGQSSLESQQEYILLPYSRPGDILQNNQNFFWASPFDSGGENIYVLGFSGVGTVSPPNPLDIALSGVSRLISIYTTYEATASDSPTKVKISGTFEHVTTNIKISGTFVEKTMKVKVGGSFV